MTVKILTDEEIIELKQSSDMKLKLRWVIFGVGVILFIVSILFYVFAWTVDWFVLDMTYNHETFGLNLSILFASLLLPFSLMLISQVWMNISKYNEKSFFIPKFMQPREPSLFYGKEKSDRKFNEIDQVQFRHFATSRFIASVLILLMASINISIFGTAIDEENHLGSWFFLGGPSMFYPMSAFLFIIALGLMFYTIFSTAIIRFTKTEHFYLVEEYRLFLPWMTEIPKEEIEGMRITNAKTGPKYFWIILAAFNLILCFTDGLYFLTNPFAFGAGLLVGKFYVITGIVHLIAICILIFKHQNMLEIITKEKRYELYFSTPSSPVVKNNILSLFNMEIEDENGKNIDNNDNIDNIDNNDNIDNIINQDLKIQDWRSITAGFIFIIIGIISTITYRGAGNPIRINLYVFGFYLIVRGLKEDFTARNNGFQITHSKKNNNLYIKKKFGWLKSYYKFNSCDKTDFKFEYKLLKLNFFDVFMAISFPFVLGLNICTFLNFVPMSSLARGMKVFQILFAIILVFVVISLIMKPTNSIYLEKENLSYNYPVPGILTNKQAEEFTDINFLKKFLYRWKYVYKNQHQAFLYRIILIGISFLFGFYFFGRYTDLLIYWLISLILLILIILSVLFGELMKFKGKNKK